MSHESKVQGIAVVKSKDQAEPHPQATKPGEPAVFKVGPRRPDGTSGPITHTRPSLRQRWRGRAATVVAAAGGLLIGLLVNALIPSADAEPKPASIDPPQPTYLAATVHRNEPITPIIPFDDLDSEVVELGRRLFHDPGLSGNGRVACVNCHHLNAGGDDGLATRRPQNGSGQRLNTPTVLNAAFNAFQYWDGRASTLEEQLNDHFQVDGAMAADWQRVVKALTLDPFYNRSFQLQFGTDPTAELVRTTLATYERSLVTPDSRFDQWLRGDATALNGEEIGGYDLFKRMNCIACHQGIGCGGTMLQPLSKFQRSAPVASATASSPNQTSTDRGAATSLLKVPALRNVAVTAPYFHDGSAPTLEEAVSRMVQEQAGLPVNTVEIQRLSAFLRSLSGTLPAKAVAEHKL